jgi:hypothetical protein
VKAFRHDAALLLAFSAALLPPAMATTPTPQSEAQLVRLSYVEGDVRFNRGDGKNPDLKKPWEQAEVNLPIGKGFALATGDGTGRGRIRDRRVDLRRRELRGPIQAIHHNGWRASNANGASFGHGDNRRRTYAQRLFVVEMSTAQFEVTSGGSGSKSRGGGGSSYGGDSGRGSSGGGGGGDGGRTK